MNTLHLKVSYNSRIATLGDENNTILKVWIVLHGYGQLATYFVRKFEAINDGNTLIVAPEGMNRFYLNGFSGRVGATWMTKEDRLTDIENNRHYLSEVFSHYKNKYPNAVFGVLAFSQGAATAVRWFCHQQPKIKQLIIWSGSFPEDLNWFEDVEKLNRVPLTFVLGDNDEFINETQLQQQSNNLKDKGLRFNIVRFKGAHDLDADTLKEMHRSL